MALSSALCMEAVRALDRIFAQAPPDEPDLGHNVTYVRGRRALQRAALDGSWEVAPDSAHAIKVRVAAAWAASDPKSLEMQLHTFADDVLRHLRSSAPQGASSVAQRIRRPRKVISTAAALTPAGGRQPLGITP